MVTVGQGMYALPVDYSEKLSDSIATSDVKSGCYVIFVFVCFAVVCVFYFSSLLFAFSFHFFFFYF